MNKEPLMAIFEAALASVDPYQAVSRALRLEDGRLYAGDGIYELASFSRVIVVGAGKATARMAEAAEKILGDAVTGGIVVVKYGHTGRLKIVEQAEAGHPIPDEAGERATKRIVDLVQGADERTLILCLLSGGGSALLVAPVPGITLQDKQNTTDFLLKAGASIVDVNAVRKHLSAVKGGRLAQSIYPATLLTLILSDVIGDRLDVIASGPTAPDHTTFRDALSVIHTYSLEHSVPSSVLSVLHLGVSGIMPDTPKEGALFFEKTRHIIVGNNALALAAACEKAGELGYAAEIVTAELRGDVREAARLLARTALGARDGLKAGKPRCLLFGGETTVTVRGTGKGGRNQELALTFAREIEGVPGITLLSAGTDGTDGPTDAAGAVVDGTTARQARGLGVDPDTHLDNNDSYAFFSRFDALKKEKNHVITGPTGTNVMDIQIILIK